MSLTYEAAQKMIDDKNDNSEITKGIRNLNYLARIFKNQRIANGALQLASTQVFLISISLRFHFFYVRLNLVLMMKHITPQMFPFTKCLKLTH